MKNASRILLPASVPATSYAKINDVVKNSTFQNISHESASLSSLREVLVPMPSLWVGF